MTAVVFADALDTAARLFWAGAGWLILTCLAAALALHTLLVAAAWPVLAAREAVSGALSASRAVRALPEVQDALRVAHAHTAPPTPSWAHTDKDAA